MQIPIESREDDYPSFASAEQFCEEAVEIKNILETTKTQVEKSEEKSSTNQTQEIPNPTQTIQFLMQLPIESREENEELKMCFQCWSCNHLLLSRKQALLHFEIFILKNTVVYLHSPE